VEPPAVSGAGPERGRPGAPSGLAPELREFIYRYCATLPAVEVMALLQSRPDVAWTAELLARHLGPRHAREAADLLAAFHWHGFLAAEPDATYRYRPRSAELGRLAGALARAYAEERLAVLAEVASLADLGPIRSFAAAFRIKKSPPDG
jgi:hypothetical protein